MRALDLPGLNALPRPAAPGAIGLFFGALLALATVPAFAQEDPRLDDLEEDVLRTQVEIYLNEFAHWDADRGRIVFERRDGQGSADLGGLEPVAELIMGRMVKPDDRGRLVLRDEIRLRPFARIAQDYIADGGMEDIEAFERFRRGDGENPFRKGLPPRVEKAIAGTLKALNDQLLAPPRGDEGDGQGGGERPRRERRVRIEVRPGPGAGDGEREEARKEEKEEKEGEGRKEESEFRREVRKRIAERLDMDPQEVEELERYARELLQQAERDLARLREELRQRIEEFRRTEPGKEFDERMEGLRRRAEEELRRALESDEFKRQLADAERRAMEFLMSPEGREMQRRIREFLESEDGRELRRRLDEFLKSERGRDLMRRLGERFRGEQRPGGEERRPAPGTGRDEDARRRAAEAERREREERRKKEKERRREREGRRLEREAF